MSIQQKIFSLFFILFTGVCFSQAMFKTSDCTERDTIKITKKGIFILKGIVTANGKPVKGVTISLDASHYDCKGKQVVSDLRKFSTKDDGSYEVKIGIDNIYLRDIYRYSWNINGYFSKQITGIISIPKGTKGSQFVMELPIELIPENKPDVNHCGIMSWSIEKNKFDISWVPCPK